MLFGGGKLSIAISFAGTGRMTVLSVLSPLVQETYVVEPISTSTPQIVLVKRESNDSQKVNEDNKGDVTI